MVSADYNNSVKFEISIIFLVHMKSLLQRTNNVKIIFQVFALMEIHKLKLIVKYGFSYNKEKLKFFPDRPS